VVCNGFPPPNSSSGHLDLGDGALLDPGLDRFQSVDGIHDTAQGWVGFQQIALDHVVHVVGDACEVDVGPGQLWVEKGILLRIISYKDRAVIKLMKLCIREDLEKMVFPLNLQQNGITPVF